MSWFVREVRRSDQEETPRRRQPAEVGLHIAAALSLQRSAGNAAVARRLARGRATRPMLQREEMTIVQRGEMSPGTIGMRSHPAWVRRASADSAQA
jgi:hypothetical protein